MRPENDPQGSGTAAGRGGTDTLGEPTVRRLVRHSHIFSSVVREILERKLLHESCTLSLTLSQFHLLKLMAHNGQHQVGEIADLLGVSPPAASKNVDKLERLGLVVRKPCKRDRRATLLSASAAGRHLVGAVEARKAERLTPVLAEFSGEELDQLSQLLERFAAALLAREESGLEPCLRCAAEFGDEDECAVARILSVCPYREIRSLHAAQAAPGES